jgi:hypothetical protein
MNTREVLLDVAGTLITIGLMVGLVLDRGGRRIRRAGLLAAVLTVAAASTPR